MKFDVAHCGAGSQRRQDAGSKPSATDYFYRPESRVAARIIVSCPGRATPTGGGISARRRGKRRKTYRPSRSESTGAYGHERDPTVKIAPVDERGGGHRDRGRTA